MAPSLDCGPEPALCLSTGGPLSGTLPSGIFEEAFVSYTIKTVEVWAADIRNRPGMLARLLESLTNAGAQLEFLVARRVNDETSRVFVAPLKGPRQKRAARDVDMVPALGMQAIRIEGPDRAGLAAEIARAVADRGVNIRGASAANVGRKSVLYLGFATPDDAQAAVKAIRRRLSGRRR